MTTSKKSGIELREGLTILKTTKGIRFEKNIENNNLITEISLNKKYNKQAIWAISGFLLAILVWQISSVPIISIVGSIILVLVSLFLSLDYIFAKSKISLILYINGKDFVEEVKHENIDEIQNFLSKLKIS